MLFYFFENIFGRGHALLLAFKLSIFNPFPSCKKWHFSLYIMSKTSKNLEHVIYKFPGPWGSRSVISQSAGGVLPALLLSSCSVGPSWSDKLWVCTVLPALIPPCPLLPAAAQWIWPWAINNPFVDENIWPREDVFQEGVLFLFLFFNFRSVFCVSRGEGGASEGSRSGRCCQSNACVTAAEVLMSFDLRRHPSVQPRAWEGNQSWL